jgi:hypothetical protein
MAPSRWSEPLFGRAESLITHASGGSFEGDSSLDNCKTANQFRGADRCVRQVAANAGDAGGSCAVAPGAEGTRAIHTRSPASAGKGLSQKLLERVTLRLVRCGLSEQ